MSGKMIPTLSYGGAQPSIMVQPYYNRPYDWGDEKCPCCGGWARSSKVVCSRCHRDAMYNTDWEFRVANVEAQLRQQKL